MDTKTFRGGKIIEKFKEANIQDEEIKQFTEKCLMKAPSYFWEIPASSSGKYHGEDNVKGGLINHVRRCLVAAKDLRFVFKLTDNEMDLVQSAIILHDTFRCGLVGKEKRRARDNELTTDNLHPLHPVIGFKDVKYNEEYKDKIELIFKMTSGHYGIWTPAFAKHKYPFLVKDENLSREELLIVFVHLCDMVSSRNDILVKMEGE